MKTINPNAVKAIAKLAFMLIAAWCIGLLLFGKGCSKQATVTPPVKALAATVKAPTQHYYDKDSLHHGTKPVSVGDIEAINLFYQNIISDLTKRLAIQTKQLQSIAAASTETNGTFSPSIVYKDSLLPCGDSIPVMQSLHFSDAWFSLQANLPTKQWKYQVKDSLTFTFYQTKRKLLLDVFSANPNTRIINATGIHLPTPPAKRWGIGLHVGYGYNGSTWQPIVSGGIQYNLITW